MARTSTLVCIVALFAGASAQKPTLDEYKAKQAEGAKNASAAEADGNKGAAVNKVIEMMQNLQLQVIAEGEKEAATYDKFACFCRDMTKEKTRAIKKGQDEAEELSANIEALQKHREELDTRIGTLNKDLRTAKKEQKISQTESDAALELYEKNEADLSAAIYGVREAIKVLKGSKDPSLLQFQSMSKTIKTALMLADALGLKAADSKAAIFLQAPERQDPPEVEMEDYKFHSGGIIETCENLQKSFTDEKNSVDADEVSRVQEFTMKKQANTDHQKALNHELDETKDAKDKAESEIAEKSQELTTVSATLMDDQQYLSELSAGCSAKAKTWDQRSRVRVAELTAITEAMDIVKATVAEKTQASTIRFVQVPAILRSPEAVANNEDAMDALETEAEDTEAATPLGFLQRRMLSVVKHTSQDNDIAKQMVVSMLQNKGKQMKSTLLLSLATQIGADPFAKIKTLIQDLIERLLTEAANEANQKGWCDKAMGDAKQKRDIASEKVDDINSAMAQEEATRDRLTEELATLAEEIIELDKAQGEAKQMRSDEKKENAETVYDANQGLEATQIAIKILSRFYATAAKATVDLSFAQGPFDDAPDAGFKNGEAYTATGSDSGGIVGMLQVIESDFVRTIKETQQAEKDAAHEHLSFMTESSKSLAEKKVATEQKTEYLDENAEKLAASKENLMTQTTVVVTSIKELLELKPTCIDTGMSYAERVARREDEIAALNKASCILNAYAKFGPDGLGDAC